MTASRAISLLGIALLCACNTSIDHLQTTAPSARFEGKQTVKEAAQCVQAGLTGIYHHMAVRRTSSDGGYRVSVSQGVADATAVYDIDLQPAGNGTRATLREQAGIKLGTPDGEPATTIQQCLDGA